MNQLTAKQFVIMRCLELPDAEIAQYLSISKGQFIFELSEIYAMLGQRLGMQLTPRHLDILRLITYTNAQIARKLNTSEETVKKKLGEIYKILGCNIGISHKRTLAIIRALKLGYLEITEVAYGDVRYTDE